MTRTLGAGLAADIAAQSGERCQLLFFDFADLSNNPTPVYFTTASRDVVWNGHTWIAVGGTMDLDALGEAVDDTGSHRLKLSGVDQSVIALVLGSRWRGRGATIYHVALDQTTGLIKTDPVIMFDGPMNGGFAFDESRDYSGGTVDVSARLTSPLTELVKYRGVRCNEPSHRAVIPGASADTFFQHVASLVFRRVFWGVPTAQPPQPGGLGPGLVNPGGPNSATGGSSAPGTGAMPGGTMAPGMEGGSSSGQAPGMGSTPGGSGWGSTPGGRPNIDPGRAG